MLFSTIKYSNNQNLKCSPSQGDLGCGRPAQGEMELPWCLHASLLLSGEPSFIMVIILRLVVLKMTKQSLVTYHVFKRPAYIVPNSTTPQVYVGGAPRSGKHGTRAGSPLRLYQLVRILAVSVLFSAIFIMAIVHYTSITLKF